MPKTTFLPQIKGAIKSILPPRIFGLIRFARARMFGQDSRYLGKTTEQIFDEVYSDGLWGRDEAGRPISGSGSHKVDLIQPYIFSVREFLASVDSKVIVDLGCGDFHIGSNFVDLCDDYCACDVSSYILSQNSSNYSIPNVVFKRLDIVNDELPAGDVAFIRQVLQHLSNNDVAKFVDTLNKSRPFKYLIVTEHLPNGDFPANRDKPSGPSIRLEVGSGIVLHDDPFNLEYQEIKVLAEVEDWTLGFKSVIRTTVYRL